MNKLVEIVVSAAFAALTMYVLVNFLTTEY